MANVFVFPDEDAYRRADEAASAHGASVQVLPVPEFCSGLVAPALVVTAGCEAFTQRLADAGVPVAGTTRYEPFKREIPRAGPPDPLWKDVFGQIRIRTFRSSFSDPTKKRVELESSHRLHPVIPYMANLIRGGAYRPEVPILAFDEEHRLLVVGPREIVITRADDLLDFWILLRTLVDLTSNAFLLSRTSMQALAEPRQGIGAVEIFKRLPSLDCRECRNQNCMEFASGLMTGRCRPEQCVPLQQAENDRGRQSLGWLLDVIGCGKPGPEAPR